MKNQNKLFKPRTARDVLAGRRFEELLEPERKLYAELRKKEATEQAQRLVDNLNSDLANYPG